MLTKPLSWAEGGRIDPDWKRKGVNINNLNMNNLNINNGLVKMINCVVRNRKFLKIATLKIPVHILSENFIKQWKKRWLLSKETGSNPVDGPFL